ncbi:MAG: hypothetical protein EHM23_22220 [Acidobacteria bacterium]|nr:MAG: hypothetical protein EHM23_22220 [Acidobacteriota bacterium]
MEFEGFKSAWQKRPLTSDSLDAPARISRSLQFLRTSSVRDLERSEELSRLIFSLLFALVIVGASIGIMPAGAGRVVAWLFAAALLADGVVGVTLWLRRRREPATNTLVQFISREQRLVDTRLQVERYSQAILLILAAVALFLQVFGPRPVDFRDDVLRMGLVTAFLAVAWRKGKSRSHSTEVARELSGYLKDLKD